MTIPAPKPAQPPATKAQKVAVPVVGGAAWFSIQLHGIWAGRINDDGEPVEGLVEKVPDLYLVSDLMVHAVIPMLAAVLAWGYLRLRRRVSRLELPG